MLPYVASQLLLRWQEYIEELYKKDLHDQDNHDGVITHLVTDIPASKVKSALQGMTTNKADGTPADLFQVLKDDNAKVLHLISRQIWKTQQWPQDGKRSVFIPITKKSNAKNAQTTTQFPSFQTIAKAPNSPSEALTACEPRASRCSSWIQKWQRNQRSNCQHPLDHIKSKRVLEKQIHLLY